MLTHSTTTHSHDFLLLPCLLLLLLPAGATCRCCSCAACLAQLPSPAATSHCSTCPWGTQVGAQARARRVVCLAAAHCSLGCHQLCVMPNTLQDLHTHCKHSTQRSTQPVGWHSTHLSSPLWAGSPRAYLPHAAPAATPLLHPTPSDCPMSCHSHPVATAPPCDGRRGLPAAG